MRKVISVESAPSLKGPVYLLGLSCGHVKRVTPLDDPRDYARAPTQSRAGCKDCAGWRPSSTKVCRDCTGRLPLSAFYRARGTTDGYQKRCKDCQHVYIATLNDGKPYIAQGQRAYKERNPLKYKARSELNNAVVTGNIIKPKVCEECGIEANLHGHHDDYTKALDVRWLCQPCHADWHKLHG